MPYRTSLGLFLLAILAGCTSTDTPPPPRPVSSSPAPVTAPAEITPVEAILAAAEKEEGITGTFRFQVKGAGRQNGWLYLNSESDYRDQRCLTLALTPPVAQALEAVLGQDPVVALKGRSVRAVGTAQRATIWFYSNGIRTDKYYYQTQIQIRDLSQIRVLP